MKKLKYLSALLIAALFVVSCDDFLDPEPDGRKNEIQIFQNYNYALGFFANLYSELPTGFHNTAGAMEDCATDNAEHSNQLSEVHRYNNGSWNALSYPDAYVYGKYYGALRKLAIFMENVDTARFVEPNTYNRSPEVNILFRERYKAEAHFLRAFYYFELVKRFGGVPIVPETRLSLKDELNLPRKSFDECVAYIVENCDAAAAKLPTKDTDPLWIGHATKASALALKARMLLYAASPLHNEANDVEKWKRAATAAKEVLDLPGYGLLTGTVIANTGMFEIWNNFYNQEVLFALPYENNNNFEFNNFPVGFQRGGGLTNPTQNLVDAFEMSNGVPINETTAYAPQNPYNRRDARLKYFIGINGSLGLQYNGRFLQTYIGGLDGFNKDAYATKTGYYIRKFINPEANLLENTKAARHSWVHFRYAEMLLNYAEAMNEAYGPEVLPEGYTRTALQAVNQVRARVSLTALRTGLTQEVFRDRLRNERRVELCFEGHRAWDVRRWMKGEWFNQPIRGMRIEKTGTTSTGADILTYEVFEVEQRSFDVTKMYLMPIPQYELIRSDALVQNPNW